MLKYKESESFDRTASHMVNEYVEYKEPILTDAEISESYYEVFKTTMIDIKAFEFAILYKKGTREMNNEPVASMIRRMA